MALPQATESAGIENRRSHRLLLHIPICVRGKNIQQHLFSEDSFTLVVNAHGGLTVLGAVVRVGDTIAVMNRNTEEQQECTVVFLGPAHHAKRQVGFEFKKSAGNFWRVDFPPADWVPSGESPA